MSLDVLKAVIQGYTDHIFDLQIMSVHQGYWAGYYSRAKKPKNPESVVKKMLKAKGKDDNKRSKQKKAEDVDVESFLARERLRLSQMK